MASRRIDLDADAGGSIGPWRIGADERPLPHLSSVDVACGFDAGDPVTMLRSVALAREQAVAVAAHPGFPDTAGFGRRDLAMSEAELHAAVLDQLGALDAFLRRHGLHPGAEGFPDRAYPSEVEAIDGGVVRLEVETLCLHGDTPGSHAAAATVRTALERAEGDAQPF